MRGLAEKIWKVFAPSLWAVSAASSSDFERDVWMPIRRNGYRSRLAGADWAGYRYIIFSSVIRLRVSDARQAW
jgi:hypothetical protein